MYAYLWVRCPRHAHGCLARVRERHRNSSDELLRVELQEPRHQPVGIDGRPQTADDSLELLLIADVVVEIDEEPLPEALLVELGVELGAVNGFVAEPDGLVARTG